MLTLAYKQTNNSVKCLLKHSCSRKTIKSYLHRNKMKTELIINETVFKQTYLCLDILVSKGREILYEYLLVK